MTWVPPQLKKKKGKQLKALLQPDPTPHFSRGWCRRKGSPGGPPRLARAPKALPFQLTGNQVLHCEEPSARCPFVNLPGNEGGPCPMASVPPPPQQPAIRVQRWVLRSTVRSSPAWSGQSFVDHRAPGRKQVAEGTWLQAPRARPAWFHSRATPPHSANHPAHTEQGPHEHEPPRPGWDLGCHQLAVSWRRPPRTGDTAPRSPLAGQDPVLGATPSCQTGLESL